MLVVSAARPYHLPWLRVIGARLWGMPVVGKPESVPDGFMERVTGWARGQPDEVSVILFGSRARGDHGSDSDWDFALLYEGELPSLEGLPSRLENRDVDWVPIERSRAVRRRNICGVPNAVAADGLCLHGTALPRPERKDVNVRSAWDLLYEAHSEMRGGMHALADYWMQPPRRRWGYDTSAARQGSKAGELLCKAVLSMRGVEPRRSHSVSELCDDLERASPGDPLLPLLRSCDGLTENAHVSVYPGLDHPREEIGVSALRLAAVLRSSGEVLAALCDVSFANEGRVGLAEVVARREALRSGMDQMQSSDCPRETLLQIKAALEAEPDDAELRDRLLVDPPARDLETAGPAWTPARR